jgi:hypothetical protein
VFPPLAPEYKGLRVYRGYWNGHRDDCDKEAATNGGDLTEALGGDRKGVFSEKEVSLKTLGRV